MCIQTLILTFIIIIIILVVLLQVRRVIYGSSAKTESPSMNNSEKKLSSHNEASLLGVDFPTGFDFEVWKTQQQSLFSSHLAKAKKKLEHKIRSMVRKEQQFIMQELEMTRAKLEQASEDLQEAQREQRQRGELLDARERALEERRLQTASRQEQLVGHLETETQRTREHYEVQVNGLREQLQEEKRHVTVLQNRLRVSEESYERLRRRVLCSRRVGVEDDDDEQCDEVLDSSAAITGIKEIFGCENENERLGTVKDGKVKNEKGKRKGSEGGLLYKDLIRGTSQKYKHELHQLQSELVFSHATVQDLNLVLRKQKEANEKCEEDKRKLLVVLREREKQLLQHVKRGETLQQMLQEKEKSTLEKHQQDLLRRERALEVKQLELANASGAGPGARLGFPSSLYSSSISRSELISAYARAASSPEGSRGGVHPPGMFSTHYSRLESGSTSPSNVIEAIADFRRDLQAQWMVPPSTLIPTPYFDSRSRCVLAEAIPTLPSDDEMNRKNATLTLSTRTASLSPADSSTRSSSSSVSCFDEQETTSEEHKHFTAREHLLHQQKRRTPCPAPISAEASQAATTSPSSDNLQKVEATYPHNSTFKGDWKETLSFSPSVSFHTSHPVEETHESSSTLPFLEVHGASRATPLHSDVNTDGGTNEEIVVSPTPVEFIQASNVSGVDSSTVVEEMQQFIQQLKINRERLLETRVYSEEHPVLREMSAKLKLYEEYVREHT